MAVAAAEAAAEAEAEAYGGIEGLWGKRRAMDEAEEEEARVARAVGAASDWAWGETEAGVEAEVGVEAGAEAEAKAPPAPLSLPAVAPLVGSNAAAHEAQWARPPRRLCALWPQVGTLSLP